MSGGTASLELQIMMARCHFQRVLPSYNAVQIALCQRVPAVNAAVSQLVEMSGHGYARAFTTLSPANWAVASDGTVYLTATLTFGTATSDWGYVPGWAMLSASTRPGWSPTVLASGRLLQPKKIKTGQVFRIPPRKLSFDFRDAA